ncbi:Nramp family divalent metal transporter [Solimonas marina]|uniref:Divalent metal cation transporter MntH n=1 Tax=Solimonas marina TaxID=2714601 RepID=A0A969W8V9_9GAMM|nr:Nramp family divalent metal transporter [Solimonas marina]NKF21633.1 Nramp family divalent metal transporter [Solimonas marina]
MFKLPKTATAPFCPSEVHGSVAVTPGLSRWKKALVFFGPGLLVSVGYMDPGNWATDIEAGARYGYALLFVVLLASLAAMLLQVLSMKLGIATGKDLARMSREHYGRRTNVLLWLLAELAIVACDLAEVLGCALALHLLFGCSVLTGVVLTAASTLIVIGLKGKGFRNLEAIVLALIGTIALCYFIELWMAKPDWAAVREGLIPSWHVTQDRDAMYLAIGILGATVMPHNLYLHSSIVQTRRIGSDEAARGEAIRFLTFDTIGSLFLAMLVNGAILVLAASAFHGTGYADVASIEDAYRLLEPIVGTAAAATLFGVALLAAGQSSTFTGTIAGQIIMEGFLDLKMPCWRRHIITRVLALVPALIGVAILGEHSVGTLLVLSQVVLSLQLPFALFPLVQFTSRRTIMGRFVNGPLTKLVAWTLFAAISAANLWLLSQFI